MMRLVWLAVAGMVGCGGSASGVDGFQDMGEVLRPADGGAQDHGCLTGTADCEWDSVQDMGEVLRPADGGAQDEGGGAQDEGGGAQDEVDGTECSETCVGAQDELGTDECAGGCQELGTEVGTEKPLLFDMDLIGSVTDADCTWDGPSVAWSEMEFLDFWKVSYSSYEVVDGQLHKIKIKGFYACPPGGGKRPGIVNAHGLGGMAKDSNAAQPAALLDMCVLAYTGPGGGDAPDNMSEGIPAGDNNGYRMFDTVTDVRGSWFWAHAVAAMRGVTCLTARPEVDPAKLGITGFSAGGVVSLIASSVDLRIKAAVPMSGTLAWDVAVQAPKAWQHNLLTQAGLTIESQEWLNLMEAIVAKDALLPLNQAQVLMVNGSTDEFFPLTAHLATYNALPGDGKRTALAANFDHGCYSLTGIESASDIEERAKVRGEGGQMAWFGHHFATDADFAYFPLPPSVQVQPAGPVTFVTALADQGGSKLKVEAVRFWASNDDAFFFASQELDDNGNGIYSALVPITIQANTVYYVDVQYKTSSLLFPKRFALASPPVIPPGFVPHIREMGSCL